MLANQRLLLVCVVVGVVCGLKNQRLLVCSMSSGRGEQKVLEIERESEKASEQANERISKQVERLRKAELSF